MSSSGSQLLQSTRGVQNTLRQAVGAGQFDRAAMIFKQLKVLLLDFDSLPPLSLETPNCAEERLLARDVYEDSILLAMGLEDKVLLEKNLQNLKPFYIPTSNIPDSSNTPLIRGVELLFLLIENRLDDFHSTLEMLNESLLDHPSIKFCTDLDQHLMVGSFDKVLLSASHPPNAIFRFLLASLIDTVRLTIGDCIAAAYETLALESGRLDIDFTKLIKTLYSINTM